MITVFSCTNRPGSNTRLVAGHYAKVLESKGLATQVFALTDLPTLLLTEARYGETPETFRPVIHRYIENVEKFVFVSPEYNGSYPGILKLFLDSLPTRIWRGKKAALVGIGDGRNGNLRGMDQLMTVLNYLRVEVFSYKVSIDKITDRLDSHGNFTDERPKKLFEKQLEGYLKF